MENIVQVTLPINQQSFKLLVVIHRSAGFCWHLLTDQDVDLSKPRHSIILRLFSAEAQTSGGEGNSMEWTRDHEIILKMSLWFFILEKGRLWGDLFVAFQYLKGSSKKDGDRQGLL